MDENNKLSKEVEEKIQNLASDVFIHVEEKLTQLMCTVTQKEPTKSTTIEQENTHLNAALLEEQKQTARQKKQLAEQDKAQQAIIAQQEATVVNQQKQISALNEKLIANTKQEQVLIGRLEQVEKQRQKSEEKSQQTEQQQAAILLEQNKQISELTQQLTTSAKDLAEIKKQHDRQLNNSTNALEQKLM